MWKHVSFLWRIRTEILIVVLCLACCVYSRYFMQTFSLVKAYVWETVGSLILFCLILDTKYNKRGLPLLVYALFVTLACVLAEDNVLAFFGQWNRGLGYDDLILYVVAGYILAVRGRDVVEFGKWSLAVVGLLYGVVSLLQIAGYSIGPVTWPCNSLAGNSNMAGFVFVLTLPFVLRKASYLLPISLAGLILSNSRAAIAGGAVVLFLWFVRSRPIRIGVAVVVIMFALGVRQLPDTNRFTHMWHYEDTPRFQVLKESIPLVSLFGMGYGNYRAKYGMIKSAEFEKQTPGVQFDGPHNVYLEHFIVNGLFATLVWLYLLVFLLRSRDRAFRYAGLGYIVVGMFSFDTVETLPLFWMILGLDRAKEIG